MKTIVNYSRWLAMLLCMFAIADVCAQQLDPLQAYIDSLAREQAVRQGGPQKVQGTVVPVDQLPAIDLSKKSFRSYLSRSEPLIINASAKFINGTISAAATFAGNGPLLKVTSGVTVMVDETAAINAGSVSSSVCTAAVGIYDCSTFIQNGNVTAPNNGSGVAIFLNSECDSYQYLSGELNGTIKNDNNGTVSGVTVGIPIDVEHFPDENFRNYLLSLSYGDDEWLTYDEIDNIKKIDVKNKSIADLAGIEYFTELDTLNCFYNNLSELDISQNTKLRYLDCRFNQIENLNITYNTLLTNLYCGRRANGETFVMPFATNPISSLNVSANSKLEYLYCDGCNLTTLNVSNCMSLKELICSENKLTSIDVSNCMSLKELICSENKLTSIDVSNCPNLEYLSCKGNLIEETDWSHAQLKYLDVSDNKLYSLYIDCPLLEKLYCDGNQLNYLNVEDCKNLLLLHCNDNSLSSLNLSANSSLTSLSCDNNTLFNLDLSANTLLSYLSCGGNSLMNIILYEDISCFAVATGGMSSQPTFDQSITKTIYRLGENRYALELPDNFDPSHLVQIILKNGDEQVEVISRANSSNTYEIIANYLVFSTDKEFSSIYYPYYFQPTNNVFVSFGSTFCIDVTVNVDWINDATTMLTPEDFAATRGHQEWMPIDYSIGNSKEFDIILPEGVTIATNSNGTPIWKFTGNEPEGTTMQMTQMGANSYHISMSNSDDHNYSLIIDSKLNILLEIDNSMSVGNYEIQFRNCYFRSFYVTSVAVWNNIICADATCTLAVTDQLLGDVNDDGVLSISDPVCLFGWLLEIEQPVFVESVADYNQDTYVTVSDGVAIIADLRSGNAAPRRYNAPALTAANDALHLGVNKSGFGVALDNESTFTAFSLDITLPEGETLRSVTLDSRRTDGHTLSWRQLADGTYRVLCFSPDLQPLVGHEGVLLTFETDGTFSGSVSIDNIRFSDPTGQEKVLAPVASMPTGIHEMESETVNTPRYTLDGRRISGTQHGVYIYNGKKIINTINN